ncbi:MAG: hypothetical protein KAH57_10375, partial [Thermoplasmata archaeon]|nr:hypothetical protein [Thermoplasmata archaeon]
IDVPWNLELYCNGNVSDYTWSWVNHVPLPSKRFFDENEIWSLKSIIFSLAVPAKNESIVQVDYNCDYSRHHSYSQNVELFRFKYIVSTGRYWNHSIDRARFEYTLHEDLYSYGGEEEWNVSQINDEIIFTRTYYDWIPDVEYVSLTWTYREEQVEKEVEDNDNFIAFWTSPLLLFTLIFIPVLFIFSKLTIRNKVKR